MLGAKRFWASILCIGLLSLLTVPAFAADPQITTKDLKGISPKHYKYLFYTIGGAAIGAGLGALVGGAPNIGKGLMLGGGGFSALYLHEHRHDRMGGWRNWAYVGSYSALGGGAGWTLCGCNNGLVAGTLIGGGASGAWLASHPQPTKTASNTNTP